MIDLPRVPTTTDPATQTPVAGQFACGRDTGLNRSAFGAYLSDDRTRSVDRNSQMPEMPQDG
jgi:hypothetical protein